MMIVYNLCKYLKAVDFMSTFIMLDENFHTSHVSLCKYEAFMKLLLGMFYFIVFYLFIYLFTTVTKFYWMF